MSQSALAAEMSDRGHSWHQQTVGRAEEGDRKIEASELADLAGIFGVPLERFFWKSADANAVGWIDLAADRLAHAADDTSNAVTAHLAAVNWARRALDDTAKYDFQRVREAREGLAQTIGELGPVEDAVARGIAAYDELTGSEGEENGPTAATL